MINEQIRCYFTIIVQNNQTFVPIYREKQY